jgi:hypothetical protein
MITVRNLDEGAKRRLMWTDSTASPTGPAAAPPVPEYLRFTP